LTHSQRQAQKASGTENASCAITPANATASCCYVQVSIDTRRKT
jgi:hypothetical protein